MIGKRSEKPSGVEIALNDVSKSYPGQRAPAVNEVTLTIPAGETVVFVGPSGCGKTTTMRMINRLIEPSSGVITIDGRDTRVTNPDRLRRHIGYAIQQAGLFPHLTVAKNIAVVPRLLRWKRKKTAARVDEMLRLVGLEPELYRDRYPRQLSGGQQQRVGVARALAADPPILLMDEPFGAVDPITRTSLQDELLSLQSRLRKTIVFVTHDFAEAVKLGDRIAVLGDQSRILQYDTPVTVLAEPADETVAGFVGHDATLKQLSLTRVEEVPLAHWAIACPADTVNDLRVRLAGRKWAVLMDSERHPVRWIPSAQLDHPAPLTELGTPVTETVSGKSTLQHALATLLAQRAGAAVVTHPDGTYSGIITVDTLIGHLAAERPQS